jgi:hypothetical protein
MSLPTEAYFDLVLPTVNRPRVFVESGTFHGKTTRWARERFLVVHTIELSPVLHAEAMRDLAPLGITCHLGDSRDVIPRLAETLTAPVVWFLDAHWTNCPGAAGKDTPLPLLEELEALAQRTQADTVIVDDVASFGRDDYQPGWGDVSVNWIAGFFPGRETVRIKDCVVVKPVEAVATCA